MSKNKQIDYQEIEYLFPYHYIARMPSDGFQEHFVDTWGINYISTIEFILSKLAKLKPDSVIDIGCGDGRLTREIANNLNPQKLIGVDNSERAINLAQAMNQAQGTNRLLFLHTDIATQHILEKFDAALLIEVFEHIPLEAAAKFIHSVRNLIKPGGRLLLTVPHKNKPLEYKHFQHFTASSISSYLNESFDILNIMPFEKRCLRRSLMTKLLCNRFFVLNNKTLLQHIYNWHKNNIFNCKNENECQRIFVEAEAK